jgi:hypothetical protein
MKPIVLAGFDDERTKLPVQVPVRGKAKPAIVKLPRFDYIEESVFDALMADLEKLDIEQQLIAVANDLAGVDPGTEVTWDVLIEEARTELEGLGVTVTRTMKQGESRDVISAPTEKVLEALQPYSTQQPLPLRKRSRSIALAMLKHVVTPEQFEWFDDLPSGALDELLTAWREASTMSLGESAASPQS